MSKKIWKFGVFFNIPLHAYLIWICDHGNHAFAYYFVIVLLTLMLDFFLSFRQLELFSAKRDRISQLWMDYLPYLLEKIMLCGAEWAICFFCTDGRLSILSDFFGYAFGCGIITVIMLLAAIVTFVTGAARTMLYHKEQG